MTPLASCILLIVALGGAQAASVPGAPDDSGRCTVDAPCDAVREWMRTEQRIEAARCKPDASAKCQALETELDQRHQLGIDRWSAFCAGAIAGHQTLAKISPSVGRPDEDYQLTCGEKAGRPFRCRFWKWTWTNALRRVGAFSIQFNQAGEDWVASNCVFCPPGKACQVLPHKS